MSIKRLFYITYGWIVIRPIRWFFWKMIANGSFGLKLIPRKNERWERWEWPNLHWWILYITVFRFFNWVNWDAWRVFCNWGGGYRRSYPWIARLIHSIGKTTAGFAIRGGQCFHCGSEDGCPVELSQEEGPYFELKKTWSVGTMDGTDHRFYGITTCPKCGYQQEYEDGSL